MKLDLEEGERRFPDRPPTRRYAFNSEQTNWLLANIDALLQAAREVERAKCIARGQAEDAGLWFCARTAAEAHLQRALRRLAAYVEGDAKAIAALEGNADAKP